MAVQAIFECLETVIVVRVLPWLSALDFCSFLTRLQQSKAVRSDSPLHKAQMSAFTVASVALLSPWPDKAYRQKATFLRCRVKLPLDLPSSESCCYHKISLPSVMADGREPQGCNGHSMCQENLKCASEGDFEPLLKLLRAHLLFGASLCQPLLLFTAQMVTSLVPFC